MGSFWRRARKFVKDRIDQRITRAGLAFALAVLLTGTGAFLSGNNLIFLVTSALMATLLVSGLVNRLSLSGLEVEFHPPEHLFARQQAIAKLTVRNQKHWLPSFAIRLASIHADGLVQPLFFPMLGGGETAVEYAAVGFSRRGRFRDNSLEFTSRFPFGFAERRARATLLADVIVYPALEATPGVQDILHTVQGEIQAMQRGQGDDFYRIRPYTSTDMARRIDWRASARHQELHVREYAREESVAVHIVVDLFTGTAGAAWLETAFESAAWLCSRLQELDVSYSLRTHQRIIRVPDDGSLYTILRYLATAEPAPFADVEGLAHLIPEDNETAAVLVFTPDAARLPQGAVHIHHVV